MSDYCVVCLEVPDKGEDPQAICDHGQGISLVHPLLDVKEVTHATAHPDQQCVPVVSAVKCKPQTTGTLMAHLPQCVCVIILIEHIVHINYDKTAVLLLGMLLPQETHRVDPPLNPGFQPPAELLRPAGLLGL